MPGELARLGAGNGGGIDLLRAVAGVVPHRRPVVVPGDRVHVIAEELAA